MSIELYIAYVLTCLLITIIPGPTVALIVANSLRYGTRAGLLNVAGTQLGLALMLGILLVGLASIIATMGWWFDWLRFAGAAYLIWMGWKLLRSTGTPGATEETRNPPRGGFVLQGFLVLMGNPKALLWFGAFIPQFVDPTGNYVGQILLLGATAMATAALTDGSYAILLGRAGNVFARSRVRLFSRIGGVCLMGGGAWLAVTRSR
ncbi:MAG: LysE family translocator [Methylobacteriaceae bacterium]|nr:LysE family translocator [Methylobacteriaceae bacterium]